MAATANFDRVYAALGEARRRPTPYPVLAEPGVVLSEFEAWLEDERQWTSGYSHQWTSLLDDLRASDGGLGKHLREHLRAGGLEAGWQELASVRGALKRKRREGGPDPVLRPRLARLVAPLREALRDASRCSRCSPRSASASSCSPGLSERKAIASSSTALIRGPGSA